MSLPDYLPGTFSIERGSIDDYRRLESLHYRQRRPASMTAIWVVRYRERDTERGARSKLAAVAVLSYPTLRCFARERALRITRLSPPELARFVNRHVRTISRVIVHPQFRSLGLAVTLVEWTCKQCDTRYVEALAQMGRAHPLFEKAGMRKYELGADRPVYYVVDKEGAQDVRDHRTERETHCRESAPAALLIDANPPP